MTKPDRPESIDGQFILDTGTGEVIKREPKRLDHYPATPIPPDMTEEELFELGCA